MPILGFSEGQFIAALLLFTRVASMFLFAPAWNSPILPRRVKAVTALAITATLVVSGASGVVAPPASLAVLILMVVREVGVGLVLGMIMEFLFAAVQFGGHIVGSEMGFGMAVIMDPQSGGQVSPIGRVYYYAALLFYLSVGGDRLLLEAFVGNLSRLPLGQLHFSGSILKALVVLSGEVYTLGFQLVAPVMVALFASSVILGIMARSVPQMNMLMLGFSLKIFVGLIFAGAMLTKWSEAFLVALSRSFEAIRGIGALLGAG